MKKRNKIIIICGVILVIALIAATTLSNFINLSTVVDHTAIALKYKTASSDEFKAVTGESTAIENQRFKFVMDTKTTHFTLTDLATNNVYTSVPVGETVTVSDEDKTRIKSELTLTYYDSQSKSKYMGSGPSSVDAGNYKILRNGNKIRIIYTFGTPSDEYFVPIAFEKEFYENSILPKITNATDVRRINRYYKLFDPAQKNDTFDEMAAKYPVIKTRPIYILVDESQSKDVMKDITGYMQKAGYTIEKYKEDVLNFNISEEALNAPTGFTVPVEYELTTTGFKASILNDQILETNKTDKIINLSLLEYFNATSGVEPQTYLVPDGSGALINTTTQNGLIYSQLLFGSDESIQTSTFGALSQNAHLPVFGAYGKNCGYLAVVEGGAYQATVQAKTKGVSAPMNTIFCDFQIRGMMTTDIGTDRNMPVINLYAKHISYDYPVINFLFLDAVQQDYSGMAAVYRNYLINAGMLNKNPFSQDMPFYLDFTCLITKNVQAMGISINKKIVLADFKGMTDVIKKLHAAGITNLRIRLKGVSPDGLSQSAAYKFQFSNKLGTLDEMNSLIESVTKAGGKIFFEGNFMEVFKDGSWDGFVPKSDGAYYLDRNLVKVSDFDRVTLEYNKAVSPRYLVSPVLLPEWVDKYIKSYQNKIISNKDSGIAWGDAGNRLYSDFNFKKDFDRSMAVSSIVETMAILKKESGSILIEGGNAYAIPYASDIISTSYQNSLFPIEKISVPFYQMVIHGFIPYSGPAMNQVSDQQKAFLANFEFGGSIYYDWIVNDDALLKSTDYEAGNYSLQYINSIDKAIEQYKSINQQMAALQEETIVKHETINDTVSITTYSSGAKAIVNYGESAIDVSGVRIEGQDWKILGGDVG